MEFRRCERSDFSSGVFGRLVFSLLKGVVVGHKLRREAELHAARVKGVYNTHPGYAYLGH